MTFLQGRHQQTLVFLCFYRDDIKNYWFRYVSTGATSTPIGFHCVCRPDTQKNIGFIACLQGRHRKPLVLLSFYRDDIKNHWFYCVCHPDVQNKHWFYCVCHPDNQKKAQALLRLPSGQAIQISGIGANQTEKVMRRVSYVQHK